MGIEAIRAAVAAAKVRKAEDEDTPISIFDNVAQTLANADAGLPPPEPTGPLIETLPRKTVEKLLMSPREKEFTFLCPAGYGDHYIGAMRSVLARVRGKLRGRAIQNFKLFKLSIVTTPQFDTVTVLRTEQRSLVGKTAYSNILETLNEEER